MKMQGSIEEMRKQRVLLAIGGLLHDIGKMMFRTLGEYDIRSNIPQMARETDYKENYRYFHAFLTHRFLREFLPKDSSKVDDRDSKTLYASAYHHKPEASKDRLSAVIYQLADWSSSRERSRRERGSESKSLRSIFQNVSLFTAKGETSEEYEYAINPLSLDKEVLFPKRVKNSSNEEGKYKKHIYSFYGEFKKISELFSTDKEKFLVRLYHLLYKYLWCIPASTFDKDHGERHYPDISLFDHSRVVAAISSSLYTIWNLEHLSNYLNNINQLKKNLKIVFIRGDITGIQKFLYGVANVKGVAKRIRGRSLFLSLLADIVARALLNELGYPFTNILYSGGGVFELIVGYEEGVEGSLAQFRKKVDEILLSNFHGSLGLVLASKVVNLDDLIDEEKKYPYAEISTDLIIDLNNNKKRRLSQLLDDKSISELMSELNRDYADIGQTYKVCPSCNQFIVPESEEICVSCKTFEDVGGALPKKKYLVFYKSTNNADFRHAYKLEGLGGISLLDEGELGEYRKILSEQCTEVYLINDTNFLEEDADGFKFLANRVPVNKSNMQETAENSHFETIMSFEDLAKKSDGDQKIAFLRADVDNLGLIFSKGLGEDYSLSRVVTLSRTLDLFFSGYLNKLLDDFDINGNKARDYIYVLYAGGDDLFLVGPWDKSLKVISEIEKQFKEFTCNNPDINISCGVFVSGSSYPIRFAAELAGKAEESAKNIKPAISALGETLTWKEFADGLKSCESFLGGFEKLSRSLLYKLYLILRNFTDKQETISDPYIYRFYPLFYYYVYRNIKDDTDRNKLIEFFLDRDYQIRKESRFKCKYVIMKTRS